MTWTRIGSQSGRSLSSRGTLTCHRVSKSNPFRCISSQDRPLPEAENVPRTDQEQLPHVSEEAAMTSKVTGEHSPELEQGSPVEEVIRQKQGSSMQIPKVLQGKTNTQHPSKRSFSTLNARFSEDRSMSRTDSAESTNAPKLWIQHSTPSLPLAPRLHMKYRYDPVVNQFTRLLMRHGKLSMAQKTMTTVLENMRKSPPPSTLHHQLLPSASPTTHLTLDPVQCLTLAVDSLAPLMRIRSQRGIAGGGVALQIPVPLGLRQRRRRAIKWVIEAAKTKRSKASGKNIFASKLSDEIISILEGRSATWEKRNGLHRLGVAARANLLLVSQSRARRM